MASREERMQQRLRGSQRRQVKDFDFELTIPVAPIDPNLNSSTSSSQVQLPKPLGLEASTSHTSVSNRHLPAAAIKPDKPRVSNSTNDANISAKRRKLETDFAPTSSTSTRSRNPPRRDIYALEDPDQREEPEPQHDSSLLEPANVSFSSAQDGFSGGQDDAPPDASFLSVDEEPAVESRIEPEVVAAVSPPIRRKPLAATRMTEEVTESPSDAPGSGRRTRLVAEAAIQASSQLHGIQVDELTEVRKKTPTVHRKRKRGDNVLKPSPVLQSRQRQTPSALEELDELSPEQPERRGDQSKAANEVHISEDGETTVHSEEQEEAEAIDDEHAAAVLKKNRGRRTSRRFTESPELGISGVPSTPVLRKPRGRRRVDSSLTQLRRSKKAVSKAQAKKAAKKILVGAGSPIPVTVHRLTRPPLYEEDETDAEILNAEIPRMKRGGVSTIDVLSNVCQEIIDTSLNTLEELGNSFQDKVSRREFKTKWGAVEEFGKELQVRLLDHSINLDNAHSLGRRVRDEQRKKLSLREDILRIRKEREQVALRMDDIRLKHEREKTYAQGRDSLNMDVHDIELAVALGKSAQNRAVDHADDMTGTEHLLKRVAGEVSNKGDSGGVLRQIKEFNAFLERAALALEGRKV
ncbi:AT hook domain-containing protein [Diplocarpon rosae]|nr:AT hook domain-containing protein [Diplocarpon rosae]